MFKTVKNRVWAFDAEWIPDPLAGRMLYNLPDDMPNKEIFEVMWEKGGATEEDPMPYLKTVLCRIVSIAARVESASWRIVFTFNLTCRMNTENQNGNWKKI